MPDQVENDIVTVLRGAPLPPSTPAGSASADGDDPLVDFSLEDQNAALETQGIQPRADPGRKPLLGDTVTYIVAAVLINDDDEVLMIQEAKESCAGKWYLPAGRMEKGEDVCRAAVREVLEETGLTFEPTSLLMVESGRGSWFRFVLTGNVRSGELKTPAHADRESLQAKWIKNLAELTLRAKDIVPLIERGREYKKSRKTKDPSWHAQILPALRVHKSLLLRLVVAIKKRANNKVHVLLSERTAWHLPTCEIHPSKSLHSTLRRFMVEIFGADVAAHRPHGVLSVELDTTGGDDGMCLTVLVAFKAPMEDVPIIGKCVWHETSQKLGDLLAVRIASRNSTFPLNVIN